MDSGMIGKIEKAILYAQEPDRTKFEKFEVTIHGDHHDHQISYNQGHWHCDCKFFQGYGVCSHVMTLERVLMGAVKTAEVAPSIDYSGMIGKIEKAMIYAQERDRIVFKQFEAIIIGDHKKHKVNYNQGHWDCDCNFYKSRGVCSHVMTFERILNNSVQTAEAIPLPA